MNTNSLSSVFICLIFSIFLSSCVTTDKSTVKHPSFVYQSSDYTLYRPDPQTSYSQLARDQFGDEKWIWKIEDANTAKNAVKTDFIHVPLKEQNLGGLFENGYQSIPILCYHQFGIKKNSPLFTPPDVFDRQMKYLKDNGYRVISPENVLAFLEYRRQIPRKSVLITIDDGYKSVYDIAVPILKKYGYTATIFVYTNYVGISKKALSWDDLRELKSYGFTIGSHTVSHADLTKKMPDETPDAYYRRIRKELSLSKKIIDRQLDQDTLSLSFPYGRQNPGVMKIAKSVGYKLAVTVDRGGNPFFTNPLALNRDMILKKDMKYFISRLKTFNTISLK